MPPLSVSGRDIFVGDEDTMRANGCIGVQVGPGFARCRESDLVDSRNYDVGTDRMAHN